MAFVLVERVICACAVRGRGAPKRIDELLRSGSMCSMLATEPSLLIEDDDGLRAALTRLSEARGYKGGALDGLSRLSGSRSATTATTPVDERLEVILLHHVG